MNRLSSQQRKFVYLGGILVLLIPIIWLGMPSAGSDSGGGKLARLRAAYDLGEHQLGKVDPTSSAMNLVLLGFRGIAADLIWVNALENEETKNWAELRANVDAIIMLQPHFVKVWQFQGWNLAWNVSAAWDLVADRYYWVKEGGKFLERGKAVNDKVAQLPFDKGRVLGQKIGRADEWRYYRKFFNVKDPNEELFKGRPDPELNPEGKDNYLAAKDQYFLANALERAHPQSVSMLEALFRCYPYRSQLSYADALQREGKFDDISRNAWEIGYHEWVEQYGHDSFDGPFGKFHLEMTPRDIEEEAKAQNVADLGEYRGYVLRMLDQTRYPNWKVRAQAEAAKKMVEAHKLIYDGQNQFRKGNLSASREMLFKGMTAYEQLLKNYPAMAREDDSIEEGMTAVLYWQKILKLQFNPIPDEYPLKAIWSSNQHALPTIESRFKRENGQS
jgi:hypothetical protein